MGAQRDTPAERMRPLELFRDTLGVIHGTDGTLGSRSSMLCEERGNNFIYKYEDLKPTEAPSITCIQCLVYEHTQIRR